MDDEVAQVDEAPVEDNAESAAIEPQAEEVVEVIEVERNGKKYQLPKELNDELMMRADYTRKTQEIAEQRKAVEQEAESRRQAIEREREMISQHEELAGLRFQLKSYEQLTPQQWAQFGQNDPAAAQAAFLQMQAIKDRASALHQQIEQDRNRKAFEKQQGTARQIEQALSEVRAAIPDWSETKDRELADYARKQLGAPEDATGLPAWVIKAVHKASLYDKSLKSATAQTPATQATPVRTISGKQTVAKDPDKMTTAEWMKWDDEQSRKKRKS
jgi:hypothetical protein